MQADHNMDAEKLISFFPTEMWTTILNHVRNSAEYQRICVSSSLFKTVLQPLKTKILFPEVIKIMCNSVENSTQFFPAVIPLRQICATWKNGLDQVLHHYEYPFATGLCPQFFNRSDVAKYQDSFPGNPFPVRGFELYFSESYSDISLEYQDLVTKMLKNFGTHIWYCYFVLAIDDDAVILQFVQKLDEVLELMPNLRQFSCFLWKKFDNHVELLERAIPTFQYLQKITFYGTPAKVCQCLVKRNPQVTEMFCYGTTSDHLNVFFEQMPSLQKVYFKITNVEHVRRLAECQVVCRLKWLQIDIEGWDVSWEDVFAVLSCQIGETLEYLKIQKLSGDASKSGGLHLPKLKTLEIFMVNPSVLDFLFPLKQNLEQLKIKLWDTLDPSGYSNETDGVIRLIRYGDKIGDSNIWDMFQKLQYVEVRQSNDRLNYKHSRRIFK